MCVSGFSYPGAWASVKDKKQQTRLLRSHCECGGYYFGGMQDQQSNLGRRNIIALPDQGFRVSKQESSTCPVTFFQNIIMVPAFGRYIAFIHCQKVICCYCFTLFIKSGIRGLGIFKFYKHKTRPWISNTCSYKRRVAIRYLRTQPQNSNLTIPHNFSSYFTHPLELYV